MLWNDRFGNWGGTKVRGQTINLTGVSKPWGDTVALDDINLTVEAGTFTVLAGPSGPLLIAFMLFQRQFVQSLMRAGIR